MKRILLALIVCGGLNAAQQEKQEVGKPACFEASTFVGRAHIQNNMGRIVEEFLSSNPARQADMRIWMSRTRCSNQFLTAIDKAQRPERIEAALASVGNQLKQETEAEFRAQFEVAKKTYQEAAIKDRGRIEGLLIDVKYNEFSNLQQEIESFVKEDDARLAKEFDAQQQRILDQSRTAKDAQLAQQLQDEENKGGAAREREAKQIAGQQAAMEQAIQQKIRFATDQAIRINNEQPLKALQEMYGNNPMVQAGVAKALQILSALQNPPQPAVPQVRTPEPSAPLLEPERKAQVAAHPCIEQPRVKQPSAPAPQEDLETLIACAESNKDLFALVALADRHNHDPRSKALIEASIARVQQDDLVEENGEQLINEGDEADEEHFKLLAQERAALQAAGGNGNPPKRPGNILTQFFGWTRRNIRAIVAVTLAAISAFIIVKKYSGRAAVASR